MNIHFSYMDLAEFNQKLALFIRDAKLMERTDPERAQKLWLKIAEFALEFSKQPGIERNFKLRLWNQINAIVKRAKGEFDSQAGGEQIKQAAPFTSPSVPADAPTQNNNLDFGFDSLPSVPMDDDSSDEIAQEKPSDEATTTAPKPTDENQDVAKEDVQKARNDFLDRINKMEDELKQMPEEFKEVNPTPYSPEKSIIPFTNLPPPEIEEQKPIVNIKKADKGLFDDNPLDLDDDTIDPYRGTKDASPDKDPFGPSINSGVTPEEPKEGYCGFCGAKMPVGSEVCPKCGATQK